MTQTSLDSAQASLFRERFQQLHDAVARVIVGQEDVIRDVLIALAANGHVLLEGVPGLGKTLLVRSLAEALELQFARVQFTPDLMPADIIGTHIISEDEQGRRAMTFQDGPVFLLADEINRATPKTQSALLEAMAERSVTTGGTPRHLPRPFFVLATQNPLEMEGTYPLPEAQLDRFFSKVTVPFPTLDELSGIINRCCNQPEASRAGEHGSKSFLLDPRALFDVIDQQRVHLARTAICLARQHIGQVFVGVKRNETHSRTGRPADCGRNTSAPAARLSENP